jgi:hypothetical protein
MRECGWQLERRLGAALAVDGAQAQVQVQPGPAGGGRRGERSLRRQRHLECQRQRLAGAIIGQAVALDHAQQGPFAAVAELGRRAGDAQVGLLALGQRPPWRTVGPRQGRS